MFCFDSFFPLFLSFFVTFIWTGCIDFSRRHWILLRARLLVASFTAHGSCCVAIVSRFHRRISQLGEKAVSSTVAVTVSGGRRLIWDWRYYFFVDGDNERNMGKVWGLHRGWHTDGLVGWDDRMLSQHDYVNFCVDSEWRSGWEVRWGHLFLFVLLFPIFL